MGAGAPAWSITAHLSGFRVLKGRNSIRYSAFISYNHRDRAWAGWLHRALEGYRVPKRLWGRPSPVGELGSRLPPVFRDREELATSSDLSLSIREALTETASLIVVCSPNAARSRWVNEEIRAFRALGRGDRIRCLIVDGEPHAADPQLECLPPALLEEGAVEPLAADVRKGQDSRTSARLKLLAGLLNVPYDELRQREAARRQRRLAIVAAASLAGLVVTSGLAVFALISRNEAVAQRKLAEQRRETAQRTLDFVTSMFKVADPSEARGATITAREIVDRGAARLETGLDDQPAVKAEMQLTLAEVYGTLGLYRRSDELVRRSILTAHDQPSLAARQFAALGESQARIGDYEAAVASFRRAAASADRSDAVDPPLRSRILFGQGQALIALERDAEAKAVLEQALRIDEGAQGAAHPDVARDLEALASLSIYAQDYPTARTLSQRALRIRMDREGAASPSVADNLTTLANIAYFEGDPATAERLYRQNLAVDEKVLGPNHPDVGLTLNNLARVVLERRAFREAEALLTRAVALNESERGEMHDDMAFIYSNLALAKRYLGKLAEAEPLFDKALAAARKHGHRTLGPILTDLAEIQCRTGRFDTANAGLAEARRVVAEDYPDDPWRMAWVDSTQGECLWRQGRRDEGARLIAQSTPVLRKRWGQNSLFGHEAARRLTMAS